MDRHFVTIGDCQLLSEAEIYKVLLVQEGFEVFLRDAELVNTNLFMGNAYGYIKIEVPNDQAEAAATFLRRLRDEHRAKQNADVDNNAEEVCLACGAEMTPTETTCQACGWSYGTSQEDQEQEGEDSQ